MTPPMSRTTPDFSSPIGRALPSRRSVDFVAGRGCYTDDVPLQDPLHVAFLRAVEPAGRIESIDADDAAKGEGVHAVHTGADIALLGALSVNPVIPIVTQLPYPVLAQGEVLAVGQPMAAVLADHPMRAQDAVEQIWAEVTATDLPERSLVAEKQWAQGDCEGVIAQAPIVVEASVQHARLAPASMEPRAIAVAYDRDTESVTIYHSTQTPHRTRSELSQILGIDIARLHVIAPDVGGAFGMKASLYPEEVFAVWAAFQHRRDVKWTATRSEEFLSATQGRGVHSRGRMAVSAAGEFLALEAAIEAPVGRWLPNSGLITGWNAARILPGGYAIKDVDITTQVFAENLGPTGIYRGAGRPEANALMERLVDKAAQATGLDPLEIRRRNLLRADQLPFETATGNLLDSGDYACALQMLSDNGAYPAAVQWRDAARAKGHLAGVGTAFYLEPSGSGWESARVTWQADGTVEVASGSSSQGHGRETAFAQIAADALGQSTDQITVLLADSRTCPEGIGALASRSTAIGGSAVLEACQNLLAQRDAGQALPLTAEVKYENKGQAWGYGAYLIAVEIDRATGTLSIRQAACVDDTGRIINPAQVEGQVRGGFAQGLGEALMEQLQYDADGQLVTGSFMDYAMPRASDIPDLTIGKFETPSPLNSLGAKGVGEAGTIGAPAALLNAALDALAPLGIDHIDMPLTPQKLWHAIHAASPDTTTNR